MFNKVILIGNLTRDPDLKYTPNGVAVSQFSLAVDRPFHNAQGNSDTDYFTIVCWRGLAETCANHLRKGRLVAVEGRLQNRHYNDNDGKKVNVTEVIAENVRFLDSSKNQNNQHNAISGGITEDHQGPFESF